MATVTGVTKAYADAIEDQIIKSANRSGTSLVLVTNAGTINVPNAFPALYETYPVGSIYFTARSDNPSTYMNGGTWVRWGKGRVPVGIDETPGETNFESLEKTGGAKTHSLTKAEMPSHNHGGNTHNESNDHSHSGYTSADGSHTHGYIAQSPSPQTANGSNNYYTGRVGTQTDASGHHSHSVQTYGVSAYHYHGISADGGGGAHNNLQPYITCYIWKRTA